ncbi:MAG TPA: hypothetical protein VFX60_09980 [Micromonospora sp.]|nr:hypothetical protein [Micromonospora sp.]
MSVEQDVWAWLRQRGAEAVEHPGGSLYAHLSRVHDRLGRLGLEADVQLAGLTHAVYSTDGFDVVLLDRTERATLQNLIGEPAECLVYLYGVCDRRRSWQRLPSTSEVWDRFTGRARTLSPGQLQQFVDLNIVNELDVIEQSPAIAEKYGAYFRSLFACWSAVASSQVTSEAQRVLGLKCHGG